MNTVGKEEKSTITSTTATASSQHTIFNKLHSFTLMNECIDFVTDIQEQQVFMVLSGAFEKSTIDITHDMPQISNIYILSDNEGQHEGWTKQWAKIKGVFTDIASICKPLQQDVYKCD
ncbi:unnamed protein product [Rotaria socialis]|nr:unnamed protein product [Rotaria socialis]